MTSKGFVVTIVPRWADIDLNQHMRNSAFADWATYARTEWLNANGFTMSKLVELELHRSCSRTGQDISRKSDSANEST